MNLLLDTHVLLWAAGHPERLTADAHALLLDPGSELYFSTVSRLLRKEAPNTADLGKWPDLFDRL